MKIQNTTFETNFVIMPTDCNYVVEEGRAMVFGGLFFAKMDLAAAACVSRALHDSPCDGAVTHKFEGTFHQPTFCGDIIFFSCTIIEVRKKAVVVEVKAYREQRAFSGRDFVAEGKFVFATKIGSDFYPHGLEL